MEENKNLMSKLKEETEKLITCLCEEGIDINNIKTLGELVDIHKDIENEEYWKVKKEDIEMRYRNYGNYEEYNESYNRRSRDSRGRYRENEYGRRGRYRGQDMLDDIGRNYDEYMEGHEQYGNYGTNESMMKIEIMADSLMDFVEHLKKEAKSPEEKQLIEDKIKELGRM